MPGAERAAALAVQAEFGNHLAVEPELNAVLGHGEFQGEGLAGLAAGETVCAHEGICVSEENLNARTYSLTDLPHSVTTRPGPRSQSIRGREDGPGLSGR